MALLLKKAGSKATLKEFRRAVKHIAEHDHLPDYQVEYDTSEDMVIFRNRGTGHPTAHNGDEYKLSNRGRSEHMRRILLNVSH